MRKRRPATSQRKTPSVTATKPEAHWLTRFEAERERADEDLARRMAEAERRG